MEEVSTDEIEIKEVDKIDEPIQFGYDQKIRFYLKKYHVWKEHRSGWGYVMNGLTNPPIKTDQTESKIDLTEKSADNQSITESDQNEKLTENQTEKPEEKPIEIYVDDVVDFTFRTRTEPYNFPWVGFIHNPPTNDSPKYIYPEGTRLNVLLENKYFKKSLKTCCGLYVFSNYLKSWLDEYFQEHHPQLTIPVFTLFHPTLDPPIHFNLEKFINNRNKKFIQVGYWLRRSISLWELPPMQISIPIIIPKIRISRYPKFKHLNGSPHIDNYTKTWLYGGYNEYPIMLWNEQNKKIHQGKMNLKDVDVKVVSSEVFDEYFSENIIFIHLTSSSVNNTVIESIIRNTPIIVNKIPPVVEYLGENYPLYFDQLEEVPLLAFDLNKIIAAHHYLVKLNKDFLSIPKFQDDFAKTLPQLNLPVRQMT